MFMIDFGDIFWLVPKIFLKGLLWNDSLLISTKDFEDNFLFSANDI